MENYETVIFCLAAQANKKSFNYRKLNKTTQNFCRPQLLMKIIANKNYMILNFSL